MIEGIHARHPAADLIALKLFLYHFPSILPIDHNPDLTACLELQSTPLSTTISHAMSRSAVDATRFTAVSPRAFARSTPSYRASPSTLSPSRAPPSNPKARINPNAPVPPRPIDPKKGALGGAPPGETPLQKVARLRQVRLKERLAEMSRWDRVVMKGRVWADFAHRTTVVIILLFTGIQTPSADLLFFPRKSTC